MTRNARLAQFVLVCTLPSLIALSSCTDEGDGGSGGGDPVHSTRSALEMGGGGAGGAGGAGAAGEPIRICTPDVVVLDGLPECFVAEVSSLPLDCGAPGHEELRPEWEKAAREAECEYRSLDAAECAALSLCGVVKASGSAQAACQAADEDADPGYCTVNQRTDGCASAEVDTLLVFGVSPDAQALQVSCAVAGAE